MSDVAVSEESAKRARADEDKALLDATREFAREKPRQTVIETVTTAVVLTATLGTAASAWLAWPLRLVGAVLAGLTLVRVFILYHDAMHGALYRGKSPFARVMRKVMWLYGLYVLTPPAVWKYTHNYHHANTAKIAGSHIGSFPMMSTEMYRRASPAQKRLYRVVRHPVTMLLGYLTIFLWGMCIEPFVRDRKKHWDSLLAAVLHVSLSAVVIARWGVSMWVFAVLLPLMVACASGAYLFYAQHNFPGVVVQPRERWSYVRAALESSSYLETGPVMAWFTGNIGYHHVHHLNPGIPFYRLPDAMKAIEALQTPHKTTLSLRDIWACLRLALWDVRKRALVPLSDLETG